MEAADESKAYITFLVPKEREAALPPLLQRLDVHKQEVWLVACLLACQEGLGTQLQQQPHVCACALWLDTELALTVRLPPAPAAPLPLCLSGCRWV